MASNKKTPPENNSQTENHINMNTSYEKNNFGSCTKKTGTTHNYYIHVYNLYES